VCRSEIRCRRSRFADKALALLDRTGDAAASKREPFLVSQAAAAMSNIQTLLETLDIERLEDAARLLARAKRVVLIGALSSHAFTEYMAYLAGLALPSWSIIGREGACLSPGIVDLGAGDAAIVITNEPYARWSVRTAQMVRAQGAHLVAITDGAHSPVGAFADSLFLVSTDSPQFFPSHVALLVLLEALMGMIVRERGAPAQKRIASVEEQNHVLGEYWQDRPAATMKGRSFEI
jgi:DNA-binding MurR/RpiR family transcriptional regulator